MNELKSLTLNGKKYDCFVDHVARGQGGGSGEGAVLYTQQELTEEQQAQARANISAVDEAKVENIVNSVIGKADLSEYQLIGQTPIYLSGANTTYDIIIEATEETNVSIISDTVAEMANSAMVKYIKCEETVENGVYTLECNSNAIWHGIHKDFTIRGLEIGKSYTLMYDARDVVCSNTVDKGIYGSIYIKTADGVETVASAMLAAPTELHTIAFTATTTDVVVQIYPVHNSMTDPEGVAIRYRDIWINGEFAKTERSAVYKWNATVSDRTDLKSISGCVTIEADPAVSVYVKTIGGDEPEGYLKGKKCVCFGDSITGHYKSPLDYPSVIANKTGMEVINAGFGGCRMAQHSNSNYTAFSMCSLADSIATGNWATQDAAIGLVDIVNSADNLAALKEVDWSTVDYITIFYGTNDFMGGISIGTDDGSLSKSQFKGALRYSIETILTAYPDIRIVLLTPIYRFWTENDTVTDSDVYAVSSGQKLTDFVKAVIDVADEYKLPAFNLYNSLGINKINRNRFLKDGTHPSSYGIDRIGESVAARLMSL